MDANQKQETPHAFYYRWLKALRDADIKCPKGTTKSSLWSYCTMVAVYGNNGIGCNPSDDTIAKRLAWGHRNQAAKYRKLAVAKGWLVKAKKLAGNENWKYDIAIPDADIYVPDPDVKLVKGTQEAQELVSRFQGIKAQPKAEPREQAEPRQPSRSRRKRAFCNSANVVWCDPCSEHYGFEKGSYGYPPEAETYHDAQMSKVKPASFSKD